MRAPPKITKVEINVTTINETGGIYPLMTPLKAIPNGTANTQPFPTFTTVDLTKLTSSPLSSGEYTPVSGDVTIQEAMNGKAVTITAATSREPSGE
mmetsp:Transcript_80/g.184  ORF Transcript_80/g.184 Transcript_80/m.184 type:complete len:96 (-) Transcript_80:357-644(-)